MNEAPSSSELAKQILDETAKITFSIENYANQSNCAKSMAFHLPLSNGRAKFVLYCHPNTNFALFGGKYTLIYLYLDSCDRDRIDIQFRLAILNAYGEKCNILEGQEHFSLTVNADKYGGLYKIQHNFLLNNAREFLPDKKLTIFCEVKEIGNNNNNTNLTQKFYFFPCPAISNLQALLESGKFTDFTLIVCGKKLTAHKNILAARSKVFAAMFEHDCQETQQNCVEITDIPVEAFEQLLRYIYTGNQPEMENYALDLFVASDKYQLIELKQECEDYLESNLNTETVAHTLVLADMHQADGLKLKCIETINSNVNAVRRTEGWNVLSTKANLMTELFLHMNEQRNSTRKSRKPKLRSSSTNRKVSPKLCRDFQLLLESGTLSDVTLIVGEKQLPAHRSILAAQSKVFSTIFEKDKQLTQLEVNLQVQVCEQMLNYIYTRNILSEKLQQFAHELFEASLKYQLEHLNYLCKQTLRNGINTETVCKTLLLAHSTQTVDLKLQCMDYIVEHSKLVIRTEGWKALIESKPELGAQLFESIAQKQW